MKTAQTNKVHRMDSRCLLDQRSNNRTGRIIVLQAEEVAEEEATGNLR